MNCATREMDQLRYIEEQVRRIARGICVPAHALPTFGSSEQSGRPHLEVSGDELHYVVCERGSEFERLSTRTLDELLYRVFRDATFDMACLHELKNRIAGQDCRRLLFSFQEELLYLFTAPEL